jgi:hypothetical protein
VLLGGTEDKTREFDSEGELDISSPGVADGASLDRTERLSLRAADGRTHGSSNGWFDDESLKGDSSDGLQLDTPDDT